MQRAGQTDPIHDDYEGNLSRFLAFLKSSDVRAFSDYPTRAFYRELHATQPEAKFILSTRSSTAVWVKSMTAFLSRFHIEMDIGLLTENFETINSNIVQLFGPSRDFITINIDDDSDSNGAILNAFLGIQNGGKFARHNASADLDVQVLSKRHKLFGGNGPEAIDLMQSQVAPAKAIISEYSWAFLVNDTNAFLDYQFGRKAWSSREAAQAVAVVDQRVLELAARRTSYLKFIVPEKSVIYREYLPRALEGLEAAAERPARTLSQALPHIVHYLDHWMHDAKSYGLLYFRGDTHTNWVGAWYVYRYIADELAKRGFLSVPRIDFGMMLPEIAGFDGDLITQVGELLREEWSARWGITSSAETLEVTVKLSLRPEHRHARRISVPESYAGWFKRETLVFERPDLSGPTVVVFRDSTADFVCDLLAEHFRRSVFVWHEGQVIEEILDLERPDLVLHIMAERFICMYPKFVPVMRVKW